MDTYVYIHLAQIFCTGIVASLPVCICLRATYLASNLQFQEQTPLLERLESVNEIITHTIIEEQSNQIQNLVWIYNIDIPPHTNFYNMLNSIYSSQGGDIMYQIEFMAKHFLSIQELGIGDPWLYFILQILSNY